MMGLVICVKNIGVMAIVTGMLRYIMPAGTMKKSGNRALSFLMLIYSAEQVMGFVGKIL